MWNREPLSQRSPVAFPRRFCRYVLWRVDRWISARCRTRVRVVEGRREAVSIGTYVPLLTAAAFYWASASYFHCDWLRPIQSAVCLQFVYDCMIDGVVVECEVCWCSSVARVISMWPVVTKAQVHLQSYNGVRNTHCYSFCRRDNWTIGFEWLLPARSSYSNVIYGLDAGLLLVNSTLAAHCGAPSVPAEILYHLLLLSAD